VKLLALPKSHLFSHLERLNLSIFSDRTRFWQGPLRILYNQLQPVCCTPWQRRSWVCTTAGQMTRQGTEGSSPNTQRRTHLPQSIERQSMLKELEEV